jgi:hypothetical protein
MSKINIIHKKLHEQGEGLHFVHNETVQDGVVKETYEIGLPGWLNDQEGLCNTITETVLDTIHSKSLIDKTYIENDDKQNYFILASALSDYVNDKIDSIETSTKYDGNTLDFKLGAGVSPGDSGKSAYLYQSKDALILYYSDIAATAFGLATAKNTYDYINNNIFEKTSNSITDSTNGANFASVNAIRSYVNDQISNIEIPENNTTIVDNVEKDNNNAVSSGGVYDAIASHIENGHHWNTVTGRLYRLDSGTDSPNTSVIHPSGEYIVLYYSSIAANVKGVAMAADTYNYISSAIFDKTVDSIHNGTSDTDFASVGAVKDYVNAQVNNIEFPTSDNITELFFPELSKEERANYIIWSNNNPVYISFADKITDGEGAFKYDSLISSFAIDLPNLENAATMFDRCYNLKNFSADITSIHNGTNMFGGCKLNKKSILKILTDIKNSEKADLGRAVNLGIWANPNLFHDSDFGEQLHEMGITINSKHNSFTMESNGGKKWNIELHFA